MHNIRKILIPILICVCFYIWFFMISYYEVNNNLFINIENITKDTIATRFLSDFFELVFAALVLIIINRKNLARYRLRIQSRYEILILAGVMILLFFLHKDFTIAGVYHFYFYLIPVAFCEEFIIRGYLYNQIQVSRKYAIIISGILFGIGHAILPSIISNADASQFLLAMASEVGGGVLIGWFFIVLQEKSKTLWVPILVHAILDYTVGIIGLLVAVITFVYFLEKAKKEKDEKWSKHILKRIGYLSDSGH